mmetsp:Transcript_91268/g.185794  ORF Transcript_91268/g.185794 Transcript_91268/m.185794 type:complete len:473 (-) Transcript_91268:189-1607(-)
MKAPQTTDELPRPAAPGRTASEARLSCGAKLLLNGSGVAGACAAVARGCTSTGAAFLTIYAQAPAPGVRPCSSQRSVAQWQPRPIAARPSVVAPSGAAATAALLVAAAAAHQGRSAALGRSRHRRHCRARLAAVAGRSEAPVASQASHEEEMLEAKAAAEIARLQLEAEQLRASAAELEAAQAEGRLMERKKWFRAFDFDGSGALDAEEVKRGMKELCGKHLDEEKAARLLKAHDMNADGLLQFEEFDLSRLQASLDKFQAEEREREDAVRREAAEREREVREREEYEQSLPIANEDTGLTTRLASVCAYLLPLMDGFQFGMPLLTAFPVLQPFFSAVFGPVQLLSAIPFWQFLLFVGMQVLGDNKDMPKLLRFNLKQAILLDVALFIPSLVRILVNSLLKDLLPGELESNLIFILATLVCVPMLLCVVYSAVCSLAGSTPRGIPYISEAAEEALGPSRPSGGDRESPPPAA